MQISPACRKQAVLRRPELLSFVRKPRRDRSLKALGQRVEHKPLFRDIADGRAHGQALAQALQLPPAHLSLLSRRRTQPRVQHFERRLPVRAVGNRELCRAGRRGGAQVGDKIRDCDVRLMADRRDDRDFRSIDRPRRHLFVERPKILH